MNVKWFVVLTLVAVLVACGFLIYQKTDAAQVAALVSIAFSIVSLHDRE